MKLKSILKIAIVALATMAVVARVEPLRSIVAGD